MYKVKYLVAIYGEKIGLTLIGIVGFRAFTRVGWANIGTMRIGPAGIILILIGLTLVVLSKHWDKN